MKLRSPSRRRTRHPVPALRRTSIVTSLAMLLMVFFPLDLMAQAPPGPSSGSGGSDDFLVAEVTAPSGSAYSRFELVVGELPETLEEMDILQAESMPDMTLRGFVQQPWGEELAEETTIGQETWIEIAAMANWLAPYSDVDLEDFDLADHPQLAGAVDQMLATTQLSFTPSASALFQAFSVALEDQPAVIKKMPAVLSGCGQDFGPFVAAHLITVTAWLGLGAAILTSPVTCLNPIAKVGCTSQKTMWVLGISSLGYAGSRMAFAQYHLYWVIDGAEFDEVGKNRHAGTSRAAFIADDSKHTLDNWNHAIVALGGTAAALTGIAGVSASWSAVLKIPDPWVWTAVAATGFSLAVTTATAHNWYICARRVIAPRLQASVIRQKIYVLTQDGRVPLPGFEQSVLTSLPHDKAREQVVEIDIDALYDVNPDFLSPFSELTQDQSVAIEVCEGVILDADPGTLTMPKQNANTHYYAGFFTSGGDCVSSWWNGIGLEQTTMIRPYAATTMHRACEDGVGADNDNNGVADSSPTEHCHNFEGGTPDPAGALEEDLFWAAPDPTVHGPTHWTGHGVDMLCNVGSLQLVSRTGLTGRDVRQEYIFNAASCWTDAATGEQVNSHHPHDSTQLRFAIHDEDWGAPRPRHCYDYDTQTHLWECNDAPGCPCGSGAGTGTFGPP